MLKDHPPEEVEDHPHESWPDVAIKAAVLVFVLVLLLCFFYVVAMSLYEHFLSRGWGGGR